MKINNRQELQSFFEKEIPLDMTGSYALVTCNNTTYSIWIANLGKGWGDDKDKIFYMEAPNKLYRYEIKDQKDREVYEIEADIIKGNIAYAIDSPQTGPFLPEVIDDIKLITIEECIEFILNENGQSFN